MAFEDDALYLYTHHNGESVIVKFNKEYEIFDVIKDVNRLDKTPSFLRRWTAKFELEKDYKKLTSLSKAMYGV